MRHSPLGGPSTSKKLVENPNYVLDEFACFPQASVQGVGAASMAFVLLRLLNGISLALYRWSGAYSDLSPRGCPDNVHR